MGKALRCGLAASGRRFTGGISHCLRSSGHIHRRAILRVRLDRTALHHSRSYLHLHWFWLGKTLAGLGNVRPFCGDGAAFPWRGGGIQIPALCPAVLPGVHIRRTAGQDRLPEPLLLGGPDQPADGVPAVASVAVGGRLSANGARWRAPRQQGRCGCYGHSWRRCMSSPA